MMPDNPRGNDKMTLQEVVIKLTELRNETTYDGYRTAIRIAIENILNCPICGHPKNTHYHHGCHQDIREKKTCPCRLSNELDFDKPEEKQSFREEMLAFGETS